MITKKPNIIFIVADDLGYADLGCYGGREPVSPVLDGLAAKGLRLTDGYANSPVCSPTRFALMTARYQYRLRGAAEEPINSKSRGSTTLGLPPAHPTLPSLLREAGYRTALIGKWHLGFPPAFGPLRSGYEEFFGPMAGGVDYFSHCASSGQHDLYEGEAQAGRRKRIQLRRDGAERGIAAAVAAEVGEAEVVGDDEDDVGSFHSAFRAGSRISAPPAPIARGRHRAWRASAPGWQRPASSARRGTCAGCRGPSSLP